ncbi:2OG-Fe(II) oxygenase [Rurimicrobium arvi]|uniref:Prolyl 4-hydroxylase alpha subunit domain-containing protein n=1 Tax=Rurimicrobium arvi TaxID=2049916 RepID=A0ABP8MFY7_9BACT
MCNPLLCSQKDLPILSRDMDLKTLGKTLGKTYQSADPVRHVVIDNFFDPDFLERVLQEFPDMDKAKEVRSFSNTNEKKAITKGESLFGECSKRLARFLNAEEMLDFLQELTGIKETLIPDPHFAGGGFHATKPGGYLKIHADFNKHNDTGLDRRVNLLVFLNKDWQEGYGGHFEFWDKEMKHCTSRVLPVFNRVVIFSTTSDSYHGHPDPLTCPEDRNRRSMAIYYYTNGRPDEELSQNGSKHNTLFVGRSGVRKDVSKFRDRLRLFIPPIILRIFNRF